MSVLFSDLLSLSQSVARVEQGILVFDEIADHAETLNKKGFGGIFGYLQKAAVTDMVMAFGRLLSRGQKEISFLSVSRSINSDILVGRTYLEKYLTENSIRFTGPELTDIFKKNFSTFEHPGYDKVRKLRDKLVAHQERGVKAEDIGASFIDAREFVQEANRKIDACYYGFINNDLNSQPLSKIEIRHTERTSGSLHRLIDLVQTVETAQG